MDERKIHNTKQNGLNLAGVTNKNNVLNKDEEFEIPFEAACSAEFSQGCFIREDNELDED